MVNHNSHLRIILISGPICSGKSSLSEMLEKKHDATIIKTKELIIEKKPRTKHERHALQKAGESLDKADGGKWVAEALQAKIDKMKFSTPSGFFVIDSVRIEGQIEAVRKAYGAEVHHIHLTASLQELEKRYNDRSRPEDEQVTYKDLKENKTEKNIDELADIADIVVKGGRCTEEAVLVRATALLNLYPRSNEKLVDVLVGGQYGSEGKGNIVGHIAPEYDYIIRVGGPNAGHQVYAEPDPEKYFHLPSGTRRAPNSKLILGPGAVIYPPKLLEEIATHDVSKGRLSIDPQAMIISDADIEIEKEGLKGISSTAQGVGMASARKITDRAKYKDGKDLLLAKDCKDLQHFICETRKLIADAIVQEKRILLEGTQGTSLSLHHGEYPHVTSRDTTVAGCLADAGIAPSNVRKIIMVCRTYPIRVGGPSGSMDKEIKFGIINERSGIPLEELKRVEKTTTTGRSRRIAEFDWVQFKDSVQFNGPTDIALTFVDYFSIENRKAYRFEQLTLETINFVEELERVSGRPVSLLSTDFNWRNVIDRRSW